VAKIGGHTIMMLVQRKRNNNKKNIECWMLGGTTIKMRDGRPTKGSYWFPDYNSTEGAKTLEFLKRLVSVVIKPLAIDFEKDFARRKYAIMLGGSWCLNSLYPIQNKNSNSK
jgi:hypothetical protein